MDDLINFEKGLIMNRQTFNRMITVAALCGIGFISTAAIAKGQADDQWYWKRLQESKQKLQQAEAAKGEERQKLMEEHMKMMKDTMEKMQAMKPKAGMTMQEHEEWINQHQKLMKDMMGQMMEEHHMMMGSDCMGMGDMHKQ